jgi:hypothetical protein
MHSPKSSRARRPSRERAAKRSSTLPQSAAASAEPVARLMNRRPLSARFAPDRDRFIRAWTRRRSRAAIDASGAAAGTGRGDGDRSHANVLRILDDVDEHRLRLRPLPAPGVCIPPPASAAGPYPCGTPAAPVGVTLRTTMDSSSSSSITSTRSLWSERYSGSIPPTPEPAPPAADDVDAAKSSLCTVMKDSLSDASVWSSPR